MLCLKCKNIETRVLDSRETDENRAIRRRRECEKCSWRFTTFERIETANFIVVKKDGARESYSREKVERGLWKACGKRPVTQEQISAMLDSLEEEWSSMGPEIDSRVIGEGIMEKLKTIDEVAYIRFASVYRHFKDIESFQKVLKELLE